LLHLPVETIGARFGGIPDTLPAPHLPPLSLAKIRDVLPPRSPSRSSAASRVCSPPWSPTA
jgi:hypothetical protein